MSNPKVIPMSKAYFFILNQVPSMTYPSIDDCVRALKSRLAYDMPLRKAKIPLYSVDSTLDVRLVRYYTIGE